MLIIAIPKSASTALMKTLGKIHNLRSTQDLTVKSLPIPENCRFIYDYHSDIRTLNTDLVRKFNSEHLIYKQHVYPSVHNMELLKQVKKVVLLRSTHDVIDAYRRGAKKKVHNLFKGFSTDMDTDAWNKKSIEVGLKADLDYFNDQWRLLNNDPNTLIIEYDDLIKNTKNTLNKIELFFGLSITEGPVKLKKVNYSKQPQLVIWWIKLLDYLEHFYLIFIRITGIKYLFRKIIKRRT